MDDFPYTREQLEEEINKTQKQKEEHEKWLLVKSRVTKIINILGIISTVLLFSFIVFNAFK